jgi:hypothetical protein
MRSPQRFIVLDISVLKPGFDYYRNPVTFPPHSFDLFGPTKMVIAGRYLILELLPPSNTKEKSAERTGS